MGKDRSGKQFCRRAGQGGQSSDNKKQNKSLNNSSQKKKETLKDHVFNFGSAKNASEFNTNAKFIINYIKRTYTEGKDIAKAMETGKDMDFAAIAPKLQPITAECQQPSHGQQKGRSPREP